MKVTKAQALRAAKKFGVNLDVIDLDTIKKGINVELEHGKQHVKTNITNDSIMTSIKIACAHLEEFPNYYSELEKMEEKLTKQWKGKRKPNIFLN
jgi:hypothetical protein